MPKVSESHLRARRQQILDAAAACFARDGFHRTSMQDIVQECGVSAGLVYRYFTSKDEMIAEIVREWHVHRADALSAVRPPPSGVGQSSAAEPASGAGPSGAGPSGAQPASMAESYLELLREIGTSDAPDPRLALQVWAETVRSPELRELAREGIEEARRTVRARAGDELPPNLDADALVRVLIAVYQGLLVQTAWDDGLDNAAYVGVVQTILERLPAG